jgi:hypothetical protein
MAGSLSLTLLKPIRAYNTSNGCYHTREHFPRIPSCILLIIVSTGRLGSNFKTSSPNQAVTANFGMVMPAWWVYLLDLPMQALTNGVQLLRRFRSDLRTFELGQDEDEKGLLESSKKLGDLISAEVDSGISSERIILGGFSQGGAMSLLTGLTSERKLGGIAVLSGFLPLSYKFKGVSAKSSQIYDNYEANLNISSSTLDVK